VVAQIVPVHMVWLAGDEQVSGFDQAPDVQPLLPDDRSCGCAGPEVPLTALGLEPVPVRRQQQLDPRPAGRSSRRKQPADREPSGWIVQAGVLLGESRILLPLIAVGIDPLASVLAPWRVRRAVGARPVYYCHMAPRPAPLPRLDHIEIREESVEPVSTSCCEADEPGGFLRAQCSAWSPRLARVTVAGAER